MNIQKQFFILSFFCFMPCLHASDPSTKKTKQQPLSPSKKHAHIDHPSVESGSVKLDEEA